MRWLVEVSSIGKTDLQKFCVEAESWQRALQAARAQRGEEGPMSGFSIELLEEGYRAVDPLARVRFVVKRAPDDTPVTAPLAKEAKGGVAPSPPSAAPPAASSAAATAVSAATEPKLPPSPASSAPATKSVAPRPPSADKSTNGPASKKGLTFNADDASAKSPPQTTSPAAKTAVPAAATAPAAAKPAAPAAAATAAPAPVGSAIPGLPAVKLLSSREQDPTDASPLTYREYSFAVPAGTSEDVAVAVLRGQLKLVDAHLTGAKMGKLVNLAVFDVEFTGKPPSPPIATLSWKDWKGDPVIGYPRRGTAQKQVKPPSGAPAATPQSTAAPASSVFPPPSAPTSGIPRPGAAAPAPAAPPVAAAPAAPAPAPVAPAAAAPAAVAAPPAPVTAAPVPQPAPAHAAPAQSSHAAPVAAPHPAPAAGLQNTFPVSPSSIPPPNPLASTAPMIPQAQLPQQPPVHPASVPPPAHASVPPPAHASMPPPAVSASQPPAVGAGGIPVPVVAPVAVFQPAPPGSVPPPAPAGVASVPPPAPAVASVPPAPAVASVPPPAMAQATSEPPPPRRSSPDGMVRTPSGRFVRGRTTGDELITALFESMHDLHFLRDALDGGQFCLALATEVLPARAAIIHFFDVEKREWIIACTRGKDTSRILTLRTPESDELLRDAARKRRALVAPNGTPSTAQRYQSLGGARSMIIAPIMQAGRALGAIEIINPLDGMPFTEDEGNAMTYIAEQYAEYLGSRGIVVDSQRIQNAAAPR